MKKLYWLLVAMWLVGGCFQEYHQPQTLTTSRVENILNDTADDLELGAKVRQLVQNQDAQRKGNNYRIQPVGKHEYGVIGLLFGVGFVLTVGAIHMILEKHNKQ